MEMNQNKVDGVPKSQILLGSNFLKLLPPRTKLFDNISSSSSQLSELSDQFSDVVYTVEVESKRKAKELYGKDLYTAFSFSPEFKTAIEQLKREMIKEKPDYLENDTLVNDKLVSENFSESKKELYEGPKEEKENIDSYEFLQFPGIDYEVEPKEEDTENRKKEKESGKDKKKKKIWLDDDETLFDTMSGYWRLISAFDEFRISPPWYDAYAEGREHWLQTNPIPTDILEDSRKKCLNWLSKYFKNE